MHTPPIEGVYPLDTYSRVIMLKRCVMIPVVRMLHALKKHYLMYNSMHILYTQLFVVAVPFLLTVCTIRHMAHDSIHTYACLSL